MNIDRSQVTTCELVQVENIDSTQDFSLTGIDLALVAEYISGSFNFVFKKRRSRLV